MNPPCVHHSQHDFRIEELEAKMKKIEMRLDALSPKIWVAVLAVIATALSTIGSIVGVVIAAYFKSRGMM